ncbi:Trypsin-like peptidase domain protein [uncultured archaeon]|nr:Trypsin-like peptidase domain protein [uncultured archaeon]
MALKRHHKIIIGGISSLLIIFMVASSMFMYAIYTKQSADYNDLNHKIATLQEKTKTQIDSLSENISGTKSELSSLGTQLSSMGEQITTLKASVSADFSDIFEESVKSVVIIKTNLAQEGSGFVIAEGGYVVTNYHVIEGATAALITTYDGKSHSVALMGYNSEMDVALLRINDTNYQPLILGDSNNVKQPDQVIAIGNSKGTGFSVTQGVVSNVHKEGSNGLDVYIQIDASLNSGNSGGPLVDINGRVIGMNTFKISDSEGMGFALESNSIKDAVNEIAMSSSAIGENLL